MKEKFQKTSCYLAGAGSLLGFWSGYWRLNSGFFSRSGQYSGFEQDAERLLMDFLHVEADLNTARARVLRELDKQQELFEEDELS